MNITFLGIGNGGGALADNLAKLGHQGTIAARPPSSETVQASQAQNSTLVAKPDQEAVDEAGIVFLAPLFQPMKQHSPALDHSRGKLLLTVPILSARALTIP